MVKKKIKQGVTLIEALFVLGIMAILLGAVFVLYAQSNQKAKINELKQEILRLSLISTTLTDGYSDFSTLNTTAIINSGLLEKKYISGGNIVTPLGGIITTSNYGDGRNSYNIWIYNLSRDACISIVEINWTNITFSLNANWIRDSNGVAFTPEQAIAACQNNNTNYIGMNFNK